MEKVYWVLLPGSARAQPLTQQQYESYMRSKFRLWQGTIQGVSKATLEKTRDVDKF